MSSIVSGVLDTLKYLGRKLPVRSLKIKHYIGIAGVCMIVIGHLLSNAGRFPLVYRILAPKYSTSISTLKKMQDRDFILKDGDKGFSEISEILKGYFEAAISREITQIKTLNWGIDTLEAPEGRQWDQYIELEASFSNEPPVAGKFYGLKSKAEQRYLTSKVLASKDGIFWTGIAISLIALFL